MKAILRICKGFEMKMEVEDYMSEIRLPAFYNKTTARLVPGKLSLKSTSAPIQELAFRQTGFPETIVERLFYTNGDIDFKKEVTTKYQIFEFIGMR